MWMQERKRSTVYNIIDTVCISISGKIFEIVRKEYQLIVQMSADVLSADCRIPFYGLDIRKIKLELFSSIADAKMYRVHIDFALFLDYTVTPLYFVMH